MVQENVRLKLTSHPAPPARVKMAHQDETCARASAPLSRPDPKSATTANILPIRIERDVRRAPENIDDIMPAASDP